MNIALFDMDHTVSDASVRDDLLKQAMASGEWDAYHSASCRDEPIPAMCALVRTLYASGVWRVAGLTSREEKWRTMTNLWLSAKETPFHEMLMRPNGDTRPSAALKLDLVRIRWPSLLHYDNVILFDDRADIVATFREAGFTACLVFGGGKKDESLSPN